MTDPGDLPTFEVRGLAATHAHEASSIIYARRICDDVSSTPIAFVDLVVVPVGAEIGDHTHEPSSREIYIVVSGEGEMLLGGDAIQIAAGSVLVNPPGGRHGLRNTGTTELCMVVVDTKTES